MTAKQLLKVSIRDVSDPTWDREYYASADEVAEKNKACAKIVLDPEFCYLEYVVEFTRVRIECAEADVA